MLGKQNEMLVVQSDRLEVYRKQVDEQHKINATYGEVLDLQAREIRASLEERKQAAEEEPRSQAAKVTAWLARSDAADAWEARIRNASDLPIFDVRAFFHKIHRIDPVPGGGNWVPVGQVGTPPDEIICVFPPQADRVVAIPEDVRKMFGELTDRTYVVSIEFTDAAGNHWNATRVAISSLGADGSEAGRAHGRLNTMPDRRYGLSPVQPTERPDHRASARRHHDVPRSRGTCTCPASTVPTAALT